jgi:hypothetical protein
LPLARRAWQFGSWWGHGHWQRFLDVDFVVLAMTGRQTTPRQEPLGPDVGFSELMTRMISANRVERARRDKLAGAGRAPQRTADETHGKPESPLV